MKKYGPLVVFSGIDLGTGLPNPKLWATPGAQLRKFDKGIHMALPPNLETPTHVHGWCLLFIGDMLALHKLLPFVETPSAYCPCRECNWDTRKPSAYEPVHFLRDGDACRWSVYSTASVEQELSRMRELGKTKAKPLMQDMGLNSLESALSPKFIPHFAYAEGTPQAQTTLASARVHHHAPSSALPSHPSPCSSRVSQGEMHNEDDGLLRAEAYQFLYLLFRKYGGSPLFDFVNAAIASWNWSGQIVQALHPSVMEGAKGGAPSPGTPLPH